MYTSRGSGSTIRRVSERTPAAAGAPTDDAGALATHTADDPSARRDRLKAVYLEARGCEYCPQLVSARTQVVFGGGNADADLMLIGEAPGAREDEEGVPFVGASGKLLAELLDAAGLAREDVFITNVLKCRPPGNRDPSPAEIDRCRPYLDEQISLVQPRVIVALGNFATRLLRGDSTGISELHGRPEVHTVAGRDVYLLPLFHPAAALYTRALLDTLREDFARLPELLARPALPQPEVVDAKLEVDAEAGVAAESAALMAAGSEESAGSSLEPAAEAGAEPSVTGQLEAADESAPKRGRTSAPDEQPPQLDLF